MPRRLVAVAVLVPWLGWCLLRVSGIALPYPVPSVLAFTPYVALTSVIPIVVALALRERVVALVAVAAAVVLAVCVVPRSIGEPEQVSGPALTLMSVNTLKGHADPAVIMRLVREHDVDVLSLQESDPQFLAALDRRGARSRFPDRSLRPIDEALLSRPPLTPTGWPAEGELTLPGGGRVIVRTVHTLPPISLGLWRAWRDELQDLPGTPADTVPRVLVGDFNATLDHPELRDVVARGYRDAADVTGNGRQSTWPSGRRWPPGITIDHVLVDPRIAVTSFAVRPVRGTDHRAVITKLALR